MIYTGTHQGRSEICSFYQIPPDRIRVLPFGTPEFALSSYNAPRCPHLLQKYQLSTEYIFYPAQFWPHKNHIVVLAACKILAETTDWSPEVVFAGSDKGNRGYVQECAKSMGLEGRTHFLGFVDQPELVELYKGAFCLVYSSFFGPDNLPPLEAFAIGCPVIAADVVGAREQLGESAIFFPPTDEHKLAEAIISLRNEEHRQQLLLAGRERAKLHNWDQYARGLIESLDEFAAIRRNWA
jgi:glycosyltransferase involved in cell wall biosynthesis